MDQLADFMLTEALLAVWHHLMLRILQRLFICRDMEILRKTNGEAQLMICVFIIVHFQQQKYKHFLIFNHVGISTQHLL
jgi:hypothetical protein